MQGGAATAEGQSDTAVAIMNAVTDMTLAHMDVAVSPNNLSYIFYDRGV